MLPTIIRDTREHEGHGYQFRASPKCAGMVTETLPFGDYALKDNLDLIVVERKSSVSELCGNLGQHRERFEAEFQRMIDAGVKRKYVIVEGHWGDIYRIHRRYLGAKIPEELEEHLLVLAEQYGVKFFIDDTESKYVRGKTRMHPNAIFESINALSIKFGIDWRFVGTREVGHRMTRSLLLKAWKYHQEGLL